MELLMCFVFLTSLANLVLTIGLATAFVRQRSDKKKTVMPPRISRQSRYFDIEGRAPNYADVGMMAPVSPQITDAPQNWDGMAKVKKNWDGFSSEES